MPADTLPTEEAVAALPALARVAFAARCARRVLPLAEGYFRGRDPQLDDAVVQAVGLAEAMGSGIQYHLGHAREFSAGARAAATYAESAFATVPGHAARAAVFAIDSYYAVQSAWDASASAARAMSDPVATIAIQLDFDSLRHVAVQHN